MVKLFLYTNTVAARKWLVKILRNDFTVENTYLKYLKQDIKCIKVFRDIETLQWNNICVLLICDVVYQKKSIGCCYIHSSELRRNFSISATQEWAENIFRNVSILEFPPCRFKNSVTEQSVLLKDLILFYGSDSL